MKLSEYIRALQALQTTDDDPTVVIRRYSDYTSNFEEDGYPKRIQLVPRDTWLMRDHPTLSPEDAAKRTTYVAVAPGN